MFIMTSLPEETIHSRICRTLTVFGLSPASLLTKIFNRPRTSIHPFLNSELNKIAVYTLESALELWTNQTLLPLFAWALPGYRDKLSDFDMTSSKLLRACQLSSFAERQIMILKFCPACVSEDIVKFGTSYWHRPHQIYGITSCHHHGIKLEYLNVPRRTHIRQDLYPPTGIAPRPANTADFEFSVLANDMLKNISEGKTTCSEYPKTLTEMGFNSSKGNLKKSILLPTLYAIASKLENTDGIFLPSSATDYHYWSTLLHNSGVQHPSKHLLLIYCLTVLSRPEDDIFIKGKENPDSDKLCSYIDKLYNKGCSFNEISRLTGKSRCFIKMVIYKRYGWDVKRSKIIDDRILNIVLSMAKKGFSRAAISHYAQVSSGSIEMIISVTPGLVDWRKKCKADSLRRRYKCQILRYILQNPGTLRRDVKEHCMAGFYWLYFHEKIWLEEHLPAKQKPTRVHKIDWEGRDKMAVLILNEAISRGCLFHSLSSMDELIGGHGWLIKKKGQFPLTLSVANSLLSK